ncbi:MAG: ATP-binding protein [Gaiellaceae bacterium]
MPVIPPLAPPQVATELLERVDELAALDACWARVQAEGHGRVVLVGGEAGVGKTVLLRRFCAEREDSARILWGGCDSLFTPRPLGPLLGLAGELGGELQTVLDGGALPHEVAAALVRELRVGAPAILVLEDAHWADEATLDVLRLLGRRLETLPLLVLVSYRNDELGSRHPLRVVVGEFATSTATNRVRLASLSAEAVAELAEPYGRDGEELYRKTAGNPFFVVEALAAGGQQIPDTVRDAVLARAAPLSGPARTLLEAVAIVPQHAEIWLLEALVDEAVASLDECLSTGMLVSEPAGVGFRHELARLAVEESVPPTRKIGLHRKTLAALAAPPSGTHDLARLAHHAEAAGDGAAVLRFAPAAGERAASLGAHREAAAQYARASRFGAALPLQDRAGLLERRAQACLLTDQYDTGIAALEEALGYWRTLGDTLREGDTLRRLSEFLWCPGRTAEAAAAAREAVRLLEKVGAGRELGMAYGNLAHTCAAAATGEEAIAWGSLALELAERLGDTESAAHALATVGVCEPGDSGTEKIERSLESARRENLTGQVGRAFVLLSGRSVDTHDHPAANRYINEGIAYCSERGVELHRLYLLAHRARLRLHEGRWDAAAESAAMVLRIPRTSTTPRITALVVRGLIRVRRGDPGHQALFDEAWALAEPTSELHRLEPVAAARAEAAWLAGDPDAVAQATEIALELAVERSAAWATGELACWRRRAGLEPGAGPSPALPEPWSLELAGRPAAAAECWTALGCPYEAALALAQVDEEAPRRRALDELHRLGARPAAAIVSRRLRAGGVRGLPRGPRPVTRENPAQLSARELEVLGLLVEGLRNREIAKRLVLATKTVDHHVAAILRKLEVRTRAEAVREAVRRLG